MKSLWDDNQSRAFGDDVLGLRVYASQLLGREPLLVLHGGGNTSAKDTVVDFFGRPQPVLHIKGSGHDLTSIDRNGFSAVRMDALQAMARLDTLTDTDMARQLRAAMLDPDSPAPSVEAILHAIIPFQFVDHTHADAVVTLSNTPDGEKTLRELYGPNMILVPYVMPGFILARHVNRMTRDIDWKKASGIILMHHGVFTFDDDARSSYEKMIAVAGRAEQFLADCAKKPLPRRRPEPLDLLKLAALRQAVSQARGSAMLAQTDDSEEAAGFAALPDISDIATRGPLTPDHVIRTKRIPVIIRNDPAADVAGYADNYRAYFSEHNPGTLSPLDPAPRWAVWPGTGTVAFGRSSSECRIIRDIVAQTRQAIVQAEQLGGWRTLSPRQLFEIEYWDLEQAKLKKAGKPAPFAGKVALVSGAASGIGRACAQALLQQGAAVVGLDIDPAIEKLFSGAGYLGLTCDMTHDQAVRQAAETAVRTFGGLDIVISNAGIFTKSQNIESLDAAQWDRSMQLNLTSHQRLLTWCIPFLSCGIDPAVVIMGSKNVPAPGPGAAAYSVAKAGLTQLARVAALELGSRGIRVNVIHPNNVFDTALWTDEVLQSRAAHYGMSVEQYKTNNVLKQEVRSADVAALACCMAGPVFSRTTGAQIPMDGGNDRVI